MRSAKVSGSNNRSRRKRKETERGSTRGRSESIRKLNKDDVRLESLEVIDGDIKTKGKFKLKLLMYVELPPRRHFKYLNSVKREKDAVKKSRNPRRLGTSEDKPKSSVKPAGTSSMKINQDVTDKSSHKKEATSRAEDVEIFDLTMDDDETSRGPAATNKPEDVVLDLTLSDDDEPIILDAEEVKNMKTESVDVEVRIRKVKVVNKKPIKVKAESPKIKSEDVKPVKVGQEVKYEDKKANIKKEDIKPPKTEPVSRKMKSDDSEDEDTANHLLDGEDEQTQDRAAGVSDGSIGGDDAISSLPTPEVTDNENDTPEPGSQTAEEASMQQSNTSVDSIGDRMDIDDEPLFPPTTSPTRATGTNNLKRKLVEYDPESDSDPEVDDHAMEVDTIAADTASASTTARQTRNKKHVCFELQYSDEDSDDPEYSDGDEGKKRKKAKKAKRQSKKAKTIPKRKDSEQYSDEDSEDPEYSDGSGDDGKKRKKTKAKRKSTKARTVSTRTDSGGREIVGDTVQAPTTGRVPPGQISQNTIDFLTRLKDPNCNDRKWFKLHEPVFRLAEQEFKDFAEVFTELLVEVDTQIPYLPPKDVVHRIYRDTRFSNDKTPYKHRFSASFSRSGRSFKKGVHAGLMPDNESLIAGGLWFPNKSELDILRANLQRPNGALQLRQLVSRPKFVELFGPAKPHPKGKRQNIFGMEGELKSAPKGISKNHKEIDLLKLKSIVVIHKFKESEVLSPTFKNTCQDILRVLQPFVHCLNDLTTVGYVPLANHQESDDETDTVDAEDEDGEAET